MLSNLKTEEVVQSMILKLSMKKQKNMKTRSQFHQMT